MPPPRRHHHQSKIQLPRVNHRIRAKEVLLIDNEGVTLGVLPLHKAQALAREKRLDLVEVAPQSRPPVCKILDYGKYRYELAKKEREAKKSTSTTKVKELKFHVNIDPHDYSVKMKHAEEFMLKGHKVKVLLQFRGREMMHQEIGKQLVKRIQIDLAHVGSADFDPKLVGRNINLMLTPLPARKRSRKYTEDLIEDNTGEQDKKNASEGASEASSTPSLEEGSSSSQVPLPSHG